jgi:hypothetical protein
MRLLMLFGGVRRRAIGAQFSALDRKIGLDRVLVVFTSDHGVAPLPERAATPAPVRRTPRLGRPVRTHAKRRCASSRPPDRPGVP